MTRWFQLIMSNDSAHEHAIFPDELNFYEVDPDAFELGEIIHRWNPESVARSTAAERDGDADDVVFAGLEMIPVFSPRLQKALQVARVGLHDLQYLPLRILQSTGKAIEGFAIANITTRVAALDRDRCYLLNEHESEIDPITGCPRITNIFTIAAYADPLVDHDAVRLTEYPHAMLVSERFVKVFNDNGFSGAHFSEIEVLPN